MHDKQSILNVSLHPRGRVFFQKRRSPTSYMQNHLRFDRRGELLKDRCTCLDDACPQYYGGMLR